MLFLFRSAPEVKKRIHSKLFCKFWEEPGYTRANLHYCTYCTCWWKSNLAWLCQSPPFGQQCSHFSIMIWAKAKRVFLLSRQIVSSVTEWMIDEMRKRKGWRWLIETPHLVLLVFGGFARCCDAHGRWRVGGGGSYGNKLSCWWLRRRIANGSVMRGPTTKLTNDYGLSTNGWFD